MVPLDLESAYERDMSSPVKEGIESGQDLI